MSERFQLLRAEPDDLTYIYDRMKEVEKREIQLQGWGRNWAGALTANQIALVGKYDGEPAATFGVFDPAPDQASVYCWLVGTDRMTPIIKSATYIARRFMQNVRTMYPGRYLVGEVWEKYETSVRWLEMVGFKRTASRYELNGEPFIILEWKQ